MDKTLGYTTWTMVYTESYTTLNSVQIIKTLDRTLGYDMDHGLYKQRVPHNAQYRSSHNIKLLVAVCTTLQYYNTTILRTKT